MNEFVRRHPAAFYAAVLLLVCAGLWVSFHEVFALWSIDGDTLDPFIILDGVAEHGWSFLRSWIYTQDNWVFSLLPLTALMRLGGFHPALVILPGWLIFVASAGLMTTLAVLSCGRAGLLMAPVALFAAMDALGGTGFLSHPVSHNVTLMWGLAAVLAGRLAISRSGWFAVLSAVLLSIASLSDPWGQAAIAGPVFCGGVAVALLRPGLRLRGVALAVAMLVSFGLCRTRMAGLLSWLPTTEFHPGNWQSINAHLGVLFTGTAQMLNILPGWTGTALLTTLVVSVVLLWVWSGSVVTIARQWRLISAPDLMVLVTLLMSCLATGVLYVIGDFPDTLNCSRFFSVCVFFVPFLLLYSLVHPGEQTPRRQRFLTGLVLCLLPVSGFLSVPSGVWKQPVLVHLDGPKNFASFLENHGLTYGYGPYWGTGPLAVTWLSQGKVTMRPVGFDAQGNIHPRGAQTSPLWYHGDTSPGAHRFFVAFVSDGENCADMAVCASGLAHRFGEPAERLDYGNTRVFVWNRAAPAPDAW